MATDPTLIQNAAEALGWVPRESPFQGTIPDAHGVADDHALFEFAGGGPISRRTVVPAGSLPASFDWRDEGLIGEPGDQGQVSACMAFATCAMGEARIEIRTGLVTLAPRFLHFCVLGRDRQTGPSVQWLAAKVLAAGLPEADDADLADKSMCPQSTATSFHAVSGFYEFDSPAAVKREIVEQGPVLALMELHDDFARWYGAGVYRPTAAPTDVFHAVCLVGYDDTRSCWIGKNSQGPDWGEDGFFRLAYDACGVLTRKPVYAIDVG